MSEVRERYLNMTREEIPHLAEDWMCWADEYIQWLEEEVERLQQPCEDGSDTNSCACCSREKALDNPTEIM
jgi:hypothetical protein